ncbi:MAG: ribonuclease HI family protein [Acidimicrobiia bacterium]
MTTEPPAKSRREGSGDPSLFDHDDGRPGRSGVDSVTVFFDGGSRGNPGPSAIGAVVVDTTLAPPMAIAEVSESIGVTTNNVAEYRALIAGLEAARALGARSVSVRGDSKLVIEQVVGRWRVKQPHLKPLHARACELLSTFEHVDLEHVRRERNTDADALVNAALDAE